MGEHTGGAGDPVGADERTLGRTHGTNGGRLRARTVALLPLLMLLGAVSRYAETRTGTDPVTRSAVTAVVALVLAAALHTGRRLLRRNKEVTPTNPVQGASLRILAIGTFGVGAPLTLLAWSRNTLNPNAVGVALAVTVVLLAFRSGRRNTAIAATMTTGTALLVIGRTLGLGFPPAQAAYLSIVSGAVLNLANAATAVAMVLVAGALFTVLHRRTVVDGITARPGTLALLFLPAAVVSTITAILTGDGPSGEPVWHLASGAAALAALAAIVTLVRRSTPLTAALGVLGAFLPMVLITARLQGAVFTAPMWVGAALVVVAALANRRTIAKTARGEAGEGEDRYPL